MTVGLGGAMCLTAAALQLLALVPGRKPRLPVLLKAATAGTHSAAILTLLECDTRQVNTVVGNCEIIMPLVSIIFNILVYLKFCQTNYARFTI